MSNKPISERLRRLLGPGEPELTCEECFEQLDVYVEREVAAGEGEAAAPGMSAHLRGCPACHEDYESLLTLVRSERT